MPPNGNEMQAAPGPVSRGINSHARRRMVPVVIVLIVIFLATAAWWYFGYYLTFVGTNDATLASDIVTLSCQVSGTVKEILVADNEEVQAGQPLMQLDPKDYEIALAQAEAALELARKQASAAQANAGTAGTQSEAASLQAQGAVSSANSGISVARADVDAAASALKSYQQKLAQAQAQFSLAERNWKRSESLAKEGVIAKKQLDQDEAAYKVALAAVEAAKADVAAQESRLQQAKERVKAADAQLTQSKGTMQSAKAAQEQAAAQQKQYEAALAQVAVAEKNVEKAKQQLSYTTLRAPAAGRIGDRSVEAGQFIVPSQPLFALVENEVWLDANFKETQMEHIKPGQAVDVSVDAFPGKTFVAKVDSISPASGAVFSLLPPENASGNFTKVVQRIPVKIVFEPGTLDGYEGLLRPGMSVIAKVRIR